MYFNRKNGTELRNYLKKLPYFALIAGVSIDDAMDILSSDSVDALRMLSVNIFNVRYQGSFAFVAARATSNKLQDKVATAKESQIKPAYVNAKISGMLAKTRCKCT